MRLAKFATATLAAAVLAVSLAAPADAASRKRYCQREATRYADSKVAGNTLVGAGIGAGVGAVGGIARGSNRWNKYYMKRYNRCMGL